MLNVYMMKLNDWKKIANLDKYTALITIEKFIRISKYKRKEDFFRSLLGELLLRSILCAEYNLKNSDLIFERDNYGKPYLKDTEGIFFNISHSGEWIACAVSDYQVGVDVEIIKEILYENIAEKFFTEDEYHYLISHQLNNRLESFYKIWTLKESYLKAIGTGLAIATNSFSVLKNNKFKLSHVKVDKHHILSVCSVHTLNKNELKIYELSDIESILIER